MGRIVFGQRSRIVDSATHSMYIDTAIMGAKLELEGDPIDGLIGRDVLQHFQLSYDGKRG